MTDEADKKIEPRYRAYSLAPSRLRDVIALIYASLWIPVAYLDGPIQTDLSYQREQGIASEYELHVLHYLVEHVGDFSAALAVPLGIVLVDIVLEKIKTLTESIRLQKIVNILQTLNPYAMLTLFLGAVIDEESESGLISMGVPALSDIPAGLVGVIAAAVVTDCLFRLTTYTPKSNQPTQSPEQLAGPMSHNPD